MGCCISTQKTNKTSPTNAAFQKKLPVPETDTLRREVTATYPSRPSTHRHLHPQPPIVEEETVKEVLEIGTSEVPKNSALNNEGKASFPDSIAEHEKKTEEEEKMTEKIPSCIGGDEKSELSELCSVSETVSTATLADKYQEEEKGCVEVEQVRCREDESPVRNRRKRAPSGDFPARSKSPARTSEPSQARRPAPSRKNRSRTPTGRNGLRTEPGDRSGRRSRSPATRAEVGRCSPRRKAAAQSPRQDPPKAADVESKAAAAQESIENPLVSLECFIFL